MVLAVMFHNKWICLYYLLLLYSVNTLLLSSVSAFFIIPSAHDVNLQHKTYASNGDIELLQSNKNLPPLPDRRACLSSISSVGIIYTAASVSAKETDLLSTLRTIPTNDNNLQVDELKDTVPITITLPLELSSGGTFSVRIIFTSDKSLEVYKAIVDTGSPYLVLPSSNDNNKPGILEQIMMNIASAANDDSSLLLSQSKYSPTEEVYGAVTGNINWKLGKFSFRDDRLQITDSSTFGVVGVLDEALTNEATGGGAYEPLALLGLIRNNNPNRRPRFPEARPTFLDQECIISDDASDDSTNKQYRIKSFSLDGRPSRELTLSTQSLIPSATTSVMELVDLRTVGDFVDHYAVLVESITFDGVSITSQSLQAFTGSRIERPIVAVFDSGLTGCLLIRNFADVIEQYMSGKGSASVTVDEFTSVSLNLTQKSKQKQTKGKRITTCNIKSSVEEDPRLFYVQPIDLDWFDSIEYSPYIVVLGQTFLTQGTLTIDIDERVATFIT